MSDLVSTGGGQNHPTGCTCPFCTTTAHTEADVTLPGDRVEPAEATPGVDAIDAAVSEWRNDNPGFAMAKNNDAVMRRARQLQSAMDAGQTAAPADWEHLADGPLAGERTPAQRDHLERIETLGVIGAATSYAHEPLPATRVWDHIHDTDRSGEPCTIDLPDGRAATITHTAMPEFNEYGGIEGRKGTYTVRVDGELVDEYHYHRAGRTGSDAAWLAAELVSREAGSETER